MKHLFNFLVLFLVVGFSSCSTHHVVSYQAKNEATSNIQIRPSSLIGETMVMVDGNLVWDKDKPIKTLTIQNVPAGKHQIEFVSNSSIYKKEINFKDSIRVEGHGETKVQFISIPPYSNGYWSFCSLLILPTWLILLTL